MSDDEMVILPPEKPGGKWRIRFNPNYSFTIEPEPRERGVQLCPLCRCLRNGRDFVRISAAAHGMICTHCRTYIDYRRTGWKGRNDWTLGAVPYSDYVLYDEAQLVLYALKKEIERAQDRERHHATA